MRRIGYLLIIAAVLVGCENQEKEFPDFDYTAVYFPIQFPVRTLILGEDRFDNSMDQELNFDMGVAIGGMYSNTRNWSVGFTIDESLCDSLGNNVQALPQSLYTLNPASEATISSGSFSGLINVQLTDNFLTDTLAVGNYYVIPLRITSTDADSILTGRPLVPDPDKRIVADWDPGAPPKDFTLFMVKYINEYHGNYLRRGVDFTLDSAGNYTDTVIYHEPYVEQDQVVSLSTSGRFELHSNFAGIKVGGGTGMKLDFDLGSGSLVVDQIPGATEVPETGSGQFVSGGDSWGGQTRNVIYLNYRYRAGSTDHQVFDTLVYRDNTVKFELFSPVVN
jgi:hypothetical protein